MLAPRPRRGPGEAQPSLRDWILIPRGCRAVVEAEAWYPSVLARRLVSDLTLPRSTLPGDLLEIRPPNDIAKAR